MVQYLHRRTRIHSVSIVIFNVNDLVDNLECEINLYATIDVLISHYSDDIESSFEKNSTETLCD